MTTPPNAQLEIRRAQPADAEAVAEVHVRTWQAAYAGLLPAEILDALDPQERAATWRQRLANPRPGAATLVAAAPHVVGFSGVGPARDDDLAGRNRGEIFAIYVIPSLWSTGAGTALLRASLDALSAYDDVVLWVLAGNERARRFYERRGFVPDGSVRKETISGAELDEVRYHRSVTTSVDGRR